MHRVLMATKCTSCRFHLTGAQTDHCGYGTGGEEWQDSKQGVICSKAFMNKKNSFRSETAMKQRTTLT